MKSFPSRKIRNIALVGHAGSGKTSLAEACWYLSGEADRLGTVADGNTVCDFDPEELRRGTSVSTALLPIEWKDSKINFIDTPGAFDFAGGRDEGIRAADCAVVVLSGKSGVTVGAEKGFAAAQKAKRATVFFVNKLNSAHADFYKVFEDLKAKFGPMVCPIVVPYVEDHKVLCYVNLLEYRAYTYENGKATAVPLPDMGHRLEGLRTAICEAVAETSEELMEKYFSGEEFTPDELIMGLASGVRKGEIAPVFCGAGATLEGVDQLLNGLLWLAPWAETDAGEIGVTPAGFPVTVEDAENSPASAIVFKTVVDPFVGKLLYFKVVTGTVRADTTLLNPRTGETEKIGKLLFVRGKKQEETTAIGMGDIGAVAKLAGTRTGDTLCDATRPVVLPSITFEAPCLSMAVTADKKGEEEKVAAGLTRLMEEDPTIAFYTDPQTHEMILSGLGEQHLDVIASRLQSKFGVKVNMQAPQVAYRETIRKSVKVQGKHKKQSGGHGQFGDVWIEFAPCDCEGLTFAESVFGGAVPKNFFPAVEKGLIESAKQGVLAGYPMVGVKATLVDGSYHPVDSSEMAFKTAASLAYKAGIPEASPVLLEPIGTLQVFVPADYTGDVMGEINRRRGRVLGMEPTEDKLTCVAAEVPMAEMHDFSTLLRSLTGGRGHFTLDFERYEQAPDAVAKKVCEARNAE